MWKKDGHKEKMREILNKKWLIVLPNGNEIIVNDLTKWCSKNNIPRGTLYTSYHKNRPSLSGYWLKNVKENINE